MSEIRKKKRRERKKGTICPRKGRGKEEDKKASGGTELIEERITGGSQDKREWKKVQL